MDAIVFSRGRSCTNWCYCKRYSVLNPAIEPGSRSLLQCQSCVPAARRKLDGVCAWLMNGVAAAFFMSLQRCACIHIDTKDDADDSQLFGTDIPISEALSLQDKEAAEARNPGKN